jgi:hypothetical protein
LPALQKKKGRPAGSKSAKRKMGLKPAFTNTCSSNSEGERDKGNDFDPTVRVLHGIFSKLERVTCSYITFICSLIFLIGAVD